MNKDGSPTSTTNSVWGINITPSVPFYIDLAGGKDFNDTFTTVGLKFGPLILPLYQSWELENKSVKDFNWVRDRMRISFSTNINLFGFQF